MNACLPYHHDSSIPPGGNRKSEKNPHWSRSLLFPCIVVVASPSYLARVVDKFQPTHIFLSTALVERTGL